MRCTEAFFTEAMFSREFLLSRRYARGVEAGQLDLSSSRFRDLRPRKRGRRGGVRLRARRRKYRLPLPSIVFGNAQSIRNKTDELEANVKFYHEFREANLVCLSETRLTENDGDQKFLASL